jgi:hypothetical protein
MRLYGYANLHETIRAKIATLTDPNDTSPNPQPIYNDVIIGHPENISIYDGNLTMIILGGVPQEGYKGIGHTC